MYILGVKVDDFTKEEILAKIDEFLVSSGQYYIITPNPEIVLKAQKDPDFQDILNYADLAIADGVGLILASILFYGWKKRIKNRVRGIDLVEWLCQTKQSSPIKFFLLGGQGQIVQLATDKLKEKYPGITIAGAFSGPQINYQGRPTSDEEETINKQAIEQINQAQPQILLVAFGAPKQEKWIYNYLAQIPSAKVAIGVGGTFDFLAGKIKRAPKIWQNLGLEWLWRLIQEPKRLSRIINAIVIFSLKVLSWKLRRYLFYRPNVCALIYQKNKILLVERVDSPGHWQMPQGGLRKDEKPEVAILRELEEELGTEKFKVKKMIPNIHRYFWPKRIYSKSFYPYKGQEQTLCLVEFTGSDSDIKLHKKEFRDWQWVLPDKFIPTLHPYRREIGQKALEEFKNLRIFKK
jgi:N-acetylglucosaminyldiphosphoundecaprenol N-acetyl-beta-D-mannosaminyltransferase